MPTALVTGAAKRVGRVIAMNLANHGWDIVLHYNSSNADAEILKEILEQKNVKVELLKYDFNNLDGIKDLVKQSHLDLLINNASIFENDNLNNMSSQSIAKHFNINIIAPMLLTQVFAERSINSANPNIINILDCEIKNVSTDFVSYHMSKKSLANFTEIAAKTLAPRIRVNGIALGQTMKNHKQSQKNFDYLVKQSLLKKIVSEENLVDTMNYLIQNKNTTGNIIFLGR